MTLKRHPANPILTRRDIPALSPPLTDVSAVFNPGAVKVADRYRLMLRVQNRGRETFLMMAESADGVVFEIAESTVQLKGIENISETVYHTYDPRITALEGHYYIMLALDLARECRLGLACTNDFSDFEFLGMVSEEDNRNGVLFPEKIGGKYLRLDRPNRLQLENGPTSGEAIWLSESDDLLRWKPVRPVMQGRPHFWDERIGSGPPPVKVRQGWLHIYHGIATHFASSNIYQAGVVLLDRDDPSKVIARGSQNILEPREMWELVGQVPNVVFPSGMIVEEYDAEGNAKPGSEVKIYYGAADTCIGLATTTIEELVTACFE